MKLKSRKFLLIILIYFLSLSFSYSDENQLKFIEIINKYKKEYSPNDNELKVNKLLMNRNNEICEKVSLEANNWSGKIFD